MDFARDKSTSVITEAEDLKLLTHVDTYGYECSGHACAIQAFPRSYRPENKLRAHFYAKSAHGPECDVAAEEKIIKRGRKGSVKQELETSPGLSPAKLHLVEVRQVVDPALTPTDRQTQSEGRSTRAGSAGQRPPGRRAANSIRPICRSFLRFPHDRDLSLHIDGINTTTYGTVFKLLKQKGFERFANQRIFYTELAWKDFEELPDQLTIFLNAGEWSEKVLKQYRVVVHWAEWTNTARTRLKNELEMARTENMDAKKMGADTRGYLFFIGEQSLEDNSVFNVHDQRLICTVHDRLEFPKTK